MQISKQRLIQIIKEELQSEDTAGMPFYGGLGDKELSAPPARGSLDDLRTNIATALSGVRP